jgi:hypothetical protein
MIPVLTQEEVGFRGLILQLMFNNGQSVIEPVQIPLGDEMIADTASSSEPNKQKSDQGKDKESDWMFHNLTELF